MLIRTILAFPGSLQSDPSATIPTVTDNLASQGTTSSAVLGMYYVPYAASDSTGVLTFGGADSSLYTGQLAYVPITQSQPSNQYWGVDQSVTYGGQTVMTQTAGIIDSGTTMIMFPSGKWLVSPSLLKSMGCPRSDGFAQTHTTRT